MKNSILIILGVAMFWSCGGGANQNDNAATNTNKDSSDVALVDNQNQSRNQESKAKSWDQEDVKDFVDKAVNGGLLEVQLGKMAQKRALSQQVKDLGKMVSTEHGETNSNLKKALQTMQLNAPTALSKEFQDKADKIEKKNGSEFDKDYIDFLVDDHENDIDKFEKAEASLPDGDLKMWVSNTLPVLRKHLSEAKYIQKQLKNTDNTNTSKK